MTLTLALTLLGIFIGGASIGSLLNIGIRRIPVEETGTALRHPYCTGCGRQPAWYECIPFLGYGMQRGKCRTCGSRLSLQYPIVEAVNGILYVIVYVVTGNNRDSLFFCLMTSALLVLSVIDFETYEIPAGINLFLLGLGVIRCILDREQAADRLIGLLAVSLFLFLLQLVTGGAAVGGGDVKLMAAAGLLLGWKLIILAFVLGCILGAVLHLLRMKLQGAEHMLAFGPYLSMGIWISALWGEDMIEAYLGFFMP